MELFTLYKVHRSPIFTASGSGCGGPADASSLCVLDQEKQRELVKTIPDERLQFEISTIEEIPVRPTSLYDLCARVVRVSLRARVCSACTLLTTLAPSCM